MYHHLKLLEPFVEKQAHGLYSITELGKKLVEKHGLIQSENKTPSVDELEFKGNPLEDIFTNRGTQVLMILILALMIHMAQLDIAIAGGAIYATFKISSFVVDIVSLVLGIGILAYVSSIFHIKDKIRFAILVRFYSMIPASVMGLGLLLAYHSGVVFSTDINTILFVVSFIGGMLVSFAGTHYLLGKTEKESAIFAAVAAIPDLFIGMVILLIET